MRPKPMNPMLLMLSPFLMDSSLGVESIHQMGLMQIAALRLVGRGQAQRAEEFISPGCSA
jgi:hypothetical protein